MCNRLYSQYAMSGTLWRLCVVPFGVLWVVPFECYGWYPLSAMGGTLWSATSGTL